jgi:hypothetical protein
MEEPFGQPVVADQSLAVLAKQQQDYCSLCKHHHGGARGYYLQPTHRLPPAN